MREKFGAFGNVNKLGQNDDFLKLAAEAGCKTWFVGFKSCSQETINKIGKKSNKVKMYASAIKKIHDYGMNIIGGFMFGFDTNKKDVFDQTAKHICSLDIDLPRFSILTPFPGTPLFTRLHIEKRIFTWNWGKYDMTHVVFQPKQMSPQTLESGRDRIGRELFTRSNVLRRIFGMGMRDIYSWVWNFSSNLTGRRHYFQRPM
ncbi:MAG: hypothetical protein KAW45_00635 [Thermoplasmatales archaeon]|nr:hypothetical protein [Thermoplasmatales archaeon]